MICFEIAFYFRHIKCTDMLHEYINVALFESTIVLLFAFPLAVSVRLPVMFLHYFLNFMHPTCTYTSSSKFSVNFLLQWFHVYLCSGSVLSLHVPLCVLPLLMHQCLGCRQRKTLM